MREWLARVRDWIGRDRLDAELDEELAFHQTMLARDGLSPDEVRRRLGSTLRAKADARARWSVPPLERLLHDARYAVRGLRRSPGFTSAVVVTLALGIGANVTMFGIVDRLLFRPPPMLRDAETAHHIHLYRTVRGVEERGGGNEHARFRDVARWTTSFSSVAGVTTREMAVGTGDATREMTIGIVSATFFGFFDAPPVVGRYFTEGEDSPPNGAPVIVLSHAMWQTRYGGRRDVLGEALRVGAATYTVIGVAPREFVGLWPERPPAAFVPMAAYGGAESGISDVSWWTTYSWGWMSTIVRRRPGVTVSQANADLSSAIERSFAAQRVEQPRMPPLAVSRPRAEIGPILQERGPDASSDAKVAAWLAGVSAIVLVIACANVANLLLARALRRRREIALRLALGVGRRRLLGQLLTETMLLAVAGGVVGLIVAHAGGATLRALLLRESEAPAGLQDPRTVWFAAIAALVVGAVTGLAPMLQTRGTTVTVDLRAGARGGTARRSRTRAALLVVQGALSVILLVGAGLFVRSLRNVERTRLGYDVEPVLLVDLHMRGTPLDSALAVALRARLLASARGAPGVVAASRQSAVPFWSSRSVSLFVAGIDSMSRLGQFDYNTVSPEFFATLGTRVVRGRGVTEEDGAQAPRVMVVSESMARTLWPGRDAMGECVRVGADTAPCTRVVGIAEDIRGRDIGRASLYYYLPTAQSRPQLGGLFVRMRGDAARSREAIRERLQREMPGDAYVTVMPLEEIVGSRKRAWRLGAAMFAAFGLIALVIASVGLYAVISYDVAQRARELGIRMALGARAEDVLRLVVAQGVHFAVAGIVIGTTIALVASRRLEPLLFEQSATDPSIYLVVATTLLAVAIVASVTPAWRATRTDPNVVLRAE